MGDAKEPVKPPAKKTGWPDVVLNFQDHIFRCFRYPVVLFLIFASVYFGWLSRGITDSEIASIMIWVSLACAAASLLVYFVYLAFQAWRHRRSWDCLVVEYQFSVFRGGDWTSAMQLYGAERFPTVSMTVWDETSHRVFPNHAYYTGFLGLVEQLYSQGLVKTPAMIEITAAATRPRRIVERARFIFWLDTKPHRLRIEIGSEMPYAERVRLRNRIIARIRQIPDVRLATPDNGCESVIAEATKE